MNHDQATQLFYRHLWPLRSTVLRTATFLTRSAAEAEDLAQETMLKAFKAIDRFDPASSAQAWLLTILRNTHIDKLRTPASRTPTLSSDDLDLAAPASSALPDARTDQDLHDTALLIEGFSDATMIAGLKSLPADICWTLLLTDVEQLDYAQASDILAVPVGTVKSRVHRGRDMLKTFLLKRTSQRSEN